MTENLTVLAFDFGMKRIGVAVGNTLTLTATPLHVVLAKDGIPDWQVIKIMIDEWRVDAFLVGIPLNMNGSEQQVTLAAKRFAEQLTVHFDKPLYITDERLSTVAVRSQLFEQGGYKAIKKAAVDCLVAKLLLENWMRQRES